ncbi:MAG: response regulator transcription factor [Gammaproteobacteria bacterium]
MASNALESFIKQIIPLRNALPPDYILIKDIRSTYAYACNNCLNLMGLHHKKETGGLTDYDINGPAAEFADHFIDQDQKVLQTKETKKFISYNLYHNDIPKLYLSVKNPIMDGDSICGTFVSMTNLPFDNNQTLFHMFKNARDYPLFESNGQFSIEITEGYRTKSIVSKKETEILFYLLRGKTAREIAQKLNRSVRTVEQHAQNIKSKLGCRTKSELIEKAIDEGYFNVIPESILKANS